MSIQLSHTGDYCRFRILDECDEMLNMGFKESVQNILAAAKGVTDLQTMLFSATKPAWVKSLEDSFLRKVLHSRLLLLCLHWNPAVVTSPATCLRLLFELFSAA